jgi:RNA polymerase sigma-70 factor (ECF subfamily)
MTSSTHRSAPGNFSATRWSVVLAAAANPQGAHEALAALCRAYWYPLYAFLRRLGISSHDAEDLTQGFFAQLLARGGLGHVDRTKGRFRTFLLASLKHFLADERDRATALKRGGGAPTIALDAADAEQRYALEPRDDLTPDRLFDRRWALAVIDRALVRLRAEYGAAGKAALFAELQPTLTAGGRAKPYSEIGAALAIEEGAVKVAVHRLRQRYGAALRAEIAETVSSPAEVREELRQLLDALGN